MNSTDKAFQRDKLLLNLIDSNCIDDDYCNDSDYDEGIAECQMLIADRLEHNDYSEVANLRRDLQRIKAEKRICKRNKNKKELALT